MNLRPVLALLIIIAVVAFVGLVRFNHQGYVTIENVSATAENVSLTELAQHNAMDDCWVVYAGKVYDITSFLPRHPGTPERILPYCGSTEFEQAFTRQHGTSKVNLLMKVGTFIGDFDVIGGVGN